MQDKILQSHYISAVGGSLELVENLSRSAAAYCVRFNWELRLNAEKDPAHIMPFVATFSQKVGVKNYQAVLVGKSCAAVTAWI